MKVGAGVLAGAAVAAASISQVPLAGAGTSPAQASQTTSTSQPQTSSSASSSSAQSTSVQSQVSSSQQTGGNLQIQLDTMTGFLTLSVSEQSLVAAIVETLIPTDSNGPGAKEAGVIYFIDRQLETDYGKNAHMYMQGPFLQPGQQKPITVDGITYSEGTMPVTIVSGMQYQYHMNLREFWRYGLQAFQAYANSAYGGNFEALSAANQVQALADLWNNKPTAFNGILPQDFFYEVFYMTWSGFLMDPLYGGNQNMVGWVYTGFNGTNQGNFYGEGHNVKELMVATTPTRLQPASLAQFQKGSP